MSTLTQTIAVDGPPDAPVDEGRGRRWIFGSFVLCPCHLPVTLAVLAAVFGGTAVGGLLRAHGLLAGVIITAGWIVGTANGFRLVRHAQRGTCPIPLRARLRRWKAAQGQRRAAHTA